MCLVYIAQQMAMVVFYNQKLENMATLDFICDFRC